MPDRVRITDVAARDGLQNEPRPIPTEGKIRLVNALLQSGADEVEISSFVSPRWIPQLADATDVFTAIAPPRGVVCSALVPNERGLEAALRVRDASRVRLGRAIPDKLSVFTAASQTFSRRNTGATIEQTIERFAPIADACRDESIPLRAYISCAIACPFEGPIRPETVARVAGLLFALGDRHSIPLEIDLGDTIGAATPRSLDELLEHLFLVHPALTAPGTPALPALTLHLHDTFGAASACVERALAMGARSFDASAAGLGGCPYASTPGRRAPGNLSTEALVDVAERAGFSSGIDRDRLAAASAIARGLVQPACDGGHP